MQIAIIGLVPPLARVREHARRCRKPLSLPREAPSHAPCENPGRLVAQLAWEFTIFAADEVSHVGYEPQPPPDPLVSSSDTRPMVCDQASFELRMVAKGF